ncbi:MAG: carboxypeptidase-like regulatory domain-containing protein [Bacteroidales bacterium]|nr:carboxypeptidase-like regulatory domain-containing protein [Bacteroidales bacterium]
MKSTKLRISIFFLCITATSCLLSQQKATIYGNVKEPDGKPIVSANVTISGRPIGAITDENGYYELEIPANEFLEIVYSFIGYSSDKQSINLKPGERREINIFLETTLEELQTVYINSKYAREGNIERIDMKEIKNLPNISGNFEAFMKTLSAVSPNNELSSQYSVRGGNFDENLVYVNDIEVYRPLLIRSGQQEGLSFTNPDMVAGVQFSAGGFDAIYGDKMSSVLDITYKRPSEFGGNVGMSLLGGSAHIEGISKNYKFTHNTGIRYKTSKYLLNALETTGDYQPSFTDFQTFMTYQVNKKFELNFLGNYSRNAFYFKPETRDTEFGTIKNSLELKIYYDGHEIDRYEAMTGAVSGIYKPNENLLLKFIASGYSTSEMETYDIEGQYLINQLDNTIGSESYGDSILNIGVGSMIDHGRNYLYANIYSFAHKGSYFIGNNKLKWGVDYKYEIIDDRLSEWVMIDSTGYSLPYSADEVILYRVSRGKNDMTSSRINSYIQNTYTFELDSSNILLTTGVRSNYWDFNEEFIITPRLSVSYIPNTSKDYMFYFATGFYYQPPFYKELRYPQAEINKEIKSQKSIHFVLGNDYYFEAWNRPFKLTTELYYKYLYDLIPYKIDNVKLVYAAENLSKGYAAGIDIKVNGEFVKDAESWMSLSLMSTKEDIKGDYYIDQNGEKVNIGNFSRPTDQLVSFGMFFQDYLPTNPTYKVHLNFVYGSRLPLTVPDFKRYDSDLKMNPYRRVDLGFSKILKSDYQNIGNNNPINFFKSIWLTAEVYNLMGFNNTMSYLWIKTVSNQVGIPQQLAVPNYLPGRRFNVRLTANF